jgi:RNA 3'-phosphate cyclase
MITIDGAKGWGQVVRTAVALSSLTLKPIEIINIRQSRPRPGLHPQLVEGIKILAEFCDAETTGLQYGSMELEFIPKKLDVKDRTIDIGTSGSIGLLLQTLTPTVIFTRNRTSLELIGGTAGLGSPTIEYIKNVTFPVLNKLSLIIPEIKIDRQGFYPRGGGRVKVDFEPVIKLNPINLTNPGKALSIRGASVVGGLPEEIAIRQAESAKNYFNQKGFEDVKIETASFPTLSQGTSITLWANCENSILGSDNIGRRGLRAEDVGKQAAENLLNSINSQSPFDKYMADQIIPYLALAKGRSEIKVEEITEHCRTNISVCEKILGCRFEIDEKNRIIEVDGIGFENKFV